MFNLYHTETLKWNFGNLELSSYQKKQKVRPFAPKLFLFCKIMINFACLNDSIKHEVAFLLISALVLMISKMTGSN